MFFRQLIDKSEWTRQEENWSPCNEYSSSASGINVQELKSAEIKETITPHNEELEDQRLNSEIKSIIVLLVLNLYAYACKWAGMFQLCHLLFSEYFSPIQYSNSWLN